MSYKIIDVTTKEPIFTGFQSRKSAGCFIDGFNKWTCLKKLNTVVIEDTEKPFRNVIGVTNDTNEDLIELVANVFYP
ncbi:MAG: hypothetical protein PHG08_00975 [Bacilli bacterium]|nr:hypothetical protein [Bacilli bacterium]